MSYLAKIRESAQHGTDKTDKTPGRNSTVGFVSTPQITFAKKNDTATRLLRIAKAKELPASLVHKLTSDELAEVTGEPDKVLAAYLRALECTRVREAGQIPDEYHKKAYCRGCGWVWLFMSGTADGCPWCWNRAKGLPIPRPAVHCIDCRHFQRTDHPHLGHCAIRQPEAPAGLWDTDRRVCVRWTPSRHG